jgi:phospholipid/cholesterol/gamma-HCH transport system permease protein
MLSDSDPHVEVETGASGTSLAVTGEMTIRTVGRLRDRFEGLDPTSEIRIELGDVTRLDTAGAWLLTTFRKRAEAAGGQVSVQDTTQEMDSVLKSVADALPEPEGRPEYRTTLLGLVEGLGRRVSVFGTTLTGLTGYLGLFLSRLFRSVGHPREFRLTSLVHHCEEVGVKAVPIVSLMAFLIGVVLAFQGAVQLRQFGAEVFVVDLIAVSILRELGILLTAIIVAGRTASAFTAAIGSMKMREEIDAMRTLGIDPAMALFVPRILALLLMLPILGLIANVAGLFGGALMSWIELGISPAMFRTRLIEGTDADHLMVGLVKAPVFAVIIGVVGCHAGMQVKGNAESLGQQTSKSVVAAIFAVIVADALFSIFFAEIGV